MDDKTLRVATVGLFWRALIAELDDTYKSTEAVSKICNANKRYVRKHFRTKEQQEVLDTIANEAWDMACDTGELVDVLVSSVVLFMFDSRYRQDLEDGGMNQKYIQTFFNAHRQSSGLKLKLANKELADVCLQCINKSIYDWRKANEQV